jgi:hypothetical protein
VVAAVEHAPLYLLLYEHLHHTRAGMQAAVTATADTAHMTTSTAICAYSGALVMLS